MKKDIMKRALFVVPLFLIIAFYYTVSTQKKMQRIRQEVNEEMSIGKKTQLQLALSDSAGNVRWFLLGEARAVGREVFFKGETRSPNAFHLAPITSRTVEFEGQFTGNVKRVGSCNVDTLQYVPHGLTHLETSAHILSPDADPPTVKDIPTEKLSGIVYLIDLSHLGGKAGEQIPWEAVRGKLEQNTFPIAMVALKTHASGLPQAYDFSGKDFLSLAPETAKGIHDYEFHIPEGNKTIDCLLLDLPSIDPESDGGKLSAHRAFFGLPGTGITADDKEKRALVELAWFSGLEEGYYYAVITPPRFETNAVTTGIVFRPLIERGK
ncbi:MAG: hypothetical protein GY950_12900 [bacterium]|nr:hypothetical protein [bacterium]